MLEAKLEMVYMVDEKVFHTNDADGSLTILDPELHCDPQSFL